MVSAPRRDKPRRNQNTGGKTSAPTYKFSDANEITRALKTTSSGGEDGLVEVIVALRNQFSLPPFVLGSAPQIASNDPRLLIAQAYLVASPGCPQLFQLWDTVYTSSSSIHPPATSLRLLVPLLSLFANLLDLLSTQYLYHQYGHAILKTLLQPINAKRLSVYISNSGGNTTDLVLVSMKLLLAMAEFAGGREKQKVIETFSWDNKVIMKLLAMRRKSKTSTHHPLMKPDIRTLTLAFLLSPLSPSSSVSTSMKQTYVSTSPYTEALALIWKGLDVDDPGVIRYVLERVWEGLWCDKTIARKDKVALFNERAFNELVKLYAHTETSEFGGDDFPADLVHHFLLAICTRPGIGVCFQDRGWYPREVEIGIDGVLDVRAGVDKLEGADSSNRIGYEETSRGSPKGMVYNKILANVLKMLKVNEDARQQELALRILAACPELIAGYWSASGLTLEPRLSSRWITNIAFMGSVISLPVPEQSFLMPTTVDEVISPSAENQKLYYPTPPPLSTILNNIIPSALSAKTNFTKILLGGTATAKPLVQHCAALALVKCLDKLQGVLDVWRRVEAALGEGQHDASGWEDAGLGDASEGQWGSRRQEVVREVRKRLPDFQVILAFVHQTELGSGPDVRKALLSEVAQRLLWAYHKCLPEAVVEAKFDYGKLLGGLENAASLSDISKEERERDASQKLAIAGQLHVLRLLKEMDQFPLTGKSGPSSRTNFYTFMKVYVSTTVPAIRSILQSSLSHLLAQSIVFQTYQAGLFNSREPELWLQCIPTIPRVQDTQTTDGIAMTDERESVVEFLDDCLGRCQKKVYSYMEDMQALVDGERLSFPSPLMMTLIEQLEAKIVHGLLSPSSVLAIVTFIRKLGFRLMGQLSDLGFLTAFSHRVDRVFMAAESDGYWLKSNNLGVAVKREVDMLKRYIMKAKGTDLPKQAPESDGAITAYLSKVENSPLPSSPSARIQAAYELVDWMRLIDKPLRSNDISRLAAVILKYHFSAVKEFFEHLDLASGLLWEGLDIPSNYSKFADFLTFNWLYIHADLQQLEDAKCRRIMVDVLAKHASAIDVKRALQLISHSLNFSSGHGYACCGISLLSSILSRAADILSSTDYLNLKEYLFTECKALKDISIMDELPPPAQDALGQLITCLNPESEHDRRIVSEITGYWVATVKQAVNQEGSNNISRALQWIPLAEPELLLDLFDFISNKTGNAHGPSTMSILRELLSTIKELLVVRVCLENDLRPRLPQLLALRPLLPGFYALEEIIATAVEFSLPFAHDGRDTRHDTRHKLLKACNSLSLSSLVQRAEFRWAHRIDTLPLELDLMSFLIQTSWSPSTVRIICGLLYRHSFSQDAFLEWITTDSCAHRSTQDLALVLHASIDSRLSRGGRIPDLEGDHWVPHFIRLVKAVVDFHHPPEMRAMCGWCVATIMTSVPNKLPQFIDLLVNEVSRLAPNSFPNELLVVASRLRNANTSVYQNVLLVILTSALQWLVRSLGSEGNESERDDVMIRLVPLITADIKHHHVEPLLTIISKNCIANSNALNLSAALVKTVPLKPVVVNRFLQSIMQHPQFFKMCSISGASTRDAIINVLFTLFYLHPVNTCQPTHVEPLVRVYQGSLSASDQKILSIFRLFETQRATSVASLLSTWSPSPHIPSADALDAIRGLDPGRVLRSCLGFPRWRKLDNEIFQTPTPHENHLYDPIFLLLLFAQMLAQSQPASALAWVELFRTNIVCVIIRALSCRDDKIREIAMLQMSSLWVSIQNADIQEKPHVVYLLNLLKDTFNSPSDQPVRRLPSYSTLILLHALRAIFYPSNFIYPLTSSFLLQRPELDTTDIPMLYGMLYSSSDNWKKERGWIIRFLADGMNSTGDWRVFKRRHTWDLLASLYQSSENDRVLRNGILEVLANITCNAQATTSLLLKSALLSWIEMQLPYCRNVEAIAWTKVLENIMVVVDPSKLESATNGAWRAALLRCLICLLDVTRKPPVLSILHLIAPAALRLCLLQSSPLPNTPTLLTLCIDNLKSMEDRSKLPHSGPTAQQQRQTSLSLPPHRSAGLFETDQPPDDIYAWGKVVECLWRVSMTLQKPDSAWDAITSRLLLWRSLTGEEGSGAGEWARMQVVANL